MLPTKKISKPEIRLTVLQIPFHTFQLRRCSRSECINIAHLPRFCFRCCAIAGQVV